MFFNFFNKKNKTPVYLWGFHRITTKAKNQTLYDDDNDDENNSKSSNCK